MLDPQGDQGFLTNLLEAYDINFMFVIDNLCCPYKEVSCCYTGSSPSPKQPDFLLNWHKEILFILPINVISAPPFFPSSLKVRIECLGFVSCLGTLLEATTFRAAAGFRADSLTSSLSDLRRWGKGCMSPWERWVLENTAVNYWESLSGLCHLMYQEWDNGLGSVTLDVRPPEAKARPDDLSRFLLVPVP